MTLTYQCSECGKNMAITTTIKKLKVLPKTCKQCNSKKNWYQIRMADIIEGVL